MIDIISDILSVEEQSTQLHYSTIVNILIILSIFIRVKWNRRCEIECNVGSGVLMPSSLEKTAHPVLHRFLCSSEHRCVHIGMAAEL